MKRIDSPGSLNGRWLDKDPATGTPGTTFKADWLNSVQEELANVISDKSGGNAELNPASQTQLLLAIQTIVDNAISQKMKIVKIDRAKDKGELLFPPKNLKADQLTAEYQLLGKRVFYSYRLNLTSIAGEMGQDTLSQLLWILDETTLPAISEAASFKKNVTFDFDFSTDGIFSQIEVLVFAMDRALLVSRDDISTIYIDRKISGDIYFGKIISVLDDTLGKDKLLGKYVFVADFGNGMKLSASVTEIIGQFEYTAV